jgi:hypothetical protein
MTRLKKFDLAKLKKVESERSVVARKIAGCRGVMFQKDEPGEERALIYHEKGLTRELDQQARAFLDAHGFKAGGDKKRR